MKLIEQEMIIEAILFAAGEPVPLEKIAVAIAVDRGTTKKLIRNLADKYEQYHRGFVIIEVEEAYQMCTNPKYFEYIRSVFKTNQRKGLSSSLMETLAIIAYKQPITKGQIEEIRGVNVDHSVNKLVEYNLICEKGRLDAPGKPILFGTSEEFLKYFGFNNLSQLPQLNDDIEALRLEATTEVDHTISITKD